MMGDTDALREILSYMQGKSPEQIRSILAGLEERANGEATQQAVPKPLSGVEFQNELQRRYSERLQAAIQSGETRRGAIEQHANIYRQVGEELVAEQEALKPPPPKRDPEQLKAEFLEKYAAIRKPGIDLRKKAALVTEYRRQGVDVDGLLEEKYS